MPTLTVEIELSDEEYANALALPDEERRRKISAVFATAPNAPGREETSPFPYFDDDEVVTPNGRRPRRPWDGQSKWDGKSTDPNDHPDFDDITAEQIAGLSSAFLEEEVGVEPRDGIKVIQEMRECLSQGKPLPTRERVLREQSLRNGK
jgi:hypothetical protein